MGVVVFVPCCDGEGEAAAATFGEGEAALFPCVWGEDEEAFLTWDVPIFRPGVALPSLRARHMPHVFLLKFLLWYVHALHSQNGSSAGPPSLLLAVVVARAGDFVPPCCRVVPVLLFVFV